MKRKATKFLALAISGIMMTSLAACGDGSTEATNDAVNPVEAEPMLSDLELEILNLETKYNKGEFTQADYLALADAYSRAGYIRRQRDILEQDYRLYEDGEAFTALQEISVNLEEETEEIRSRAQEMLNNLELTEYLDESINLIDSEDWFATMMPKLKEGQRNYYQEQNGEPLLYTQVGYTEEGQYFSKVWYTGDQAKRFLSQEGTTIRLVSVTPGADASADRNDWSGAFEAWSVDCASGSITHEQGTMQKGVLSGDYTCEVHAGEGSQEAFSLWSNREGMEYVTYTGSFDEQGRIQTEQPSDDVKKKLLEGTEYTDLILYAYDATGENCLWQGIAADTTVEEYCFGGELIGLQTCPEYTAYEVAEDMTAENTTVEDGAAADGETADNTDQTADSTDPQIRIFDGEIQWFDGKYWVSAGSVREMAKQDPFAAYEENHGMATAGTVTGSITGRLIGNDGQNVTDTTPAGSTSGDKNSGSIQKPAATQTPAATAKPSTTKPAASKPAVTPAPTPAPTPVPAPAQDDDDDDDDDDGGSNDSGDSGNSDSGSSDSGSSDSGNSDSGNSGGDNGGSDVDMDWTPDLL